MKVRFLSFQKIIFSLKIEKTKPYFYRQQLSNMSYEITGKLAAKFDTIQRTETFKTREFVLEKSEDVNGRIITNYVKFQCVQDKTALLDRYSIGDDLKISFNLRGTKWVKDGRENYITNLDAWRIETVKLGQQEAVPESNFSNIPPPPSDLSDDLPF